MSKKVITLLSVIGALIVTATTITVIMLGKKNDEPVDVDNMSTGFSDFYSEKQENSTSTVNNTTSTTRKAQSQTTTTTKKSEPTKLDWKSAYKDILNNIGANYEPVDLYTIKLMDYDMNGEPELHFIATVGAKGWWANTTIFHVSGGQLVKTDGNYYDLGVEVPKLYQNSATGEYKWLSETQQNSEGHFPPDDVYEVNLAGGQLKVTKMSFNKQELPVQWKEVQGYESTLQNSGGDGRFEYLEENNKVTAGEIDRFLNSYKKIEFSKTQASQTNATKQNNIVVMSNKDKKFFDEWYQFIPKGKVGQRNAYDLLRFILIELGANETHNAEKVNTFAKEMFGETKKLPTKIPSSILDIKYENGEYTLWGSGTGFYTNLENVQLFDVGNGQYKLTGRAIAYDHGEYSPEPHDIIYDRQFEITMQKNAKSPNGWQILNLVEK